MSSPHPSPRSPTPSPRIVRVRKSGSREASTEGAKPPSASLVSSALAPDSLGWSLLLAARVLAQVHGGKSLSEALLVLVRELPAARAAAQDVAYGVLRRYGWGEFILGRLMSKPVSHPETQALLLGALYRLETRPDSSPMVVDQAAAAAGELAGGVFKGLVNGVLRNYLRQREALIAALADDDVAQYQHPPWWLARLRRAYRDHWSSIVAAGNSQPPMTLRVNQRHGTAADYMARLEAAGLAACPVGRHGLIMETPVSVDTLPGFFDGLVSVQDAGAQRAVELLAPAPGSRVLDACAAPGGKTAHLLESAELDLLALDIDAGRARRIDENLHRLGLLATVKVADCIELERWWDGRLFDAILADVPCSASGVVRRHPDIKHLRRESDIRRFAHSQAAILDALWPLLKPGGKLLYATCSVFPEENSAQIDAFLVRQAGALRLLDEQLLPQEKNDGFYYALLRKAV
ncbi:16S rRNA (cytosine(967)-C(5))-methyltransferase RsmB [Propionivibrio sp.]|uniref:16S rRNA (cytosine(967)-C(5))-methyltransferase RsmB n=1 Tax=Propionivibrio sp. TaxID=2212460 RepID=UPI00260D795D|nr:16S rRNA (cytosine(967)-C(5))-methyltransferase RsmB [Propionivibrio sp.]